MSDNISEHLLTASLLLGPRLSVLNARPPVGLTATVRERCHLHFTAEQVEPACPLCPMQSAPYKVVSTDAGRMSRGMNERMKGCVDGESLANSPPLVPLSLCMSFEIGAHGANLPRQTLQFPQSVLSHNSGVNAHANHLQD